jgi:hypothetical protein
MGPQNWVTAKNAATAARMTRRSFMSNDAESDGRLRNSFSRYLGLLIARGRKVRNRKIPHVSPLESSSALSFGTSATGC